MMWFGKIAEQLGLKTEEISVEDFSRLSNGIHPNRNMQIIKRGSSKRRRMGIELVVLKPKSLSILFIWMLYFDVKTASILERIDQSSLLSLLRFIEAEHSYVRVRIGKQRTYIKTQSALMGCFSHLFNGHQIAHWHWHVWAAPLSNYNGAYLAMQNEHVVKSAILYGLLYRADLMKRLILEGFGVQVNNNKMGFFELNDVPKKIIDLFSSRSDEIEEYKREFEFQYPNAPRHTISHLAKFKNRQKKSEKDVSKIIKSNVEKLESAGFTIEYLSGLRLKKKIVAPINLAQIIYEIYQKEGGKLFEFSKERILKNIALAAIVQGTGAYIEEIYKPFQGGDYVEVIKKMIHQQIQTIERKQHVGRNRQRIIEKYTGGVFKLSNRAYKNARRAYEYFDKYYQNTNGTIYITIDERLFTLCSRENREYRETLWSHTGAKTISEVLLFHRTDEVDISDNVDQSDIARKQN
jgi:conjugative relaxase-like TrwC/TraI family protein